jgi:hypothetical protein
VEKYPSANSSRNPVLPSIDPIADVVIEDVFRCSTMMLQAVIQSLRDIGLKQCITPDSVSHSQPHRIPRNAGEG